MNTKFSLKCLLLLSVVLTSGQALACGLGDCIQGYHRTEPELRSPPSKVMINVGNAANICMTEKRVSQIQSHIESMGCEIADSVQAADYVVEFNCGNAANGSKKPNEAQITITDNSGRLLTLENKQGWRLFTSKTGLIKKLLNENLTCYTIY